MSLRTHVLTVLSVLLALAVGVALGAGPLQRDAGAAVVDRSTGDTSADQGREAEIAALRASGAAADDFATAAAPRLLGRSLQGRVVTVLALPTASSADVAGVGRLVRVGGGAVGGTLQLSPRLLAVADKQLVDQLTSQLQGRAAGTGTGPYERAGALLGRAVASSRPGGAAPDVTATRIVAGLASARLVSGQGSLRRRGDLVLVVAGPGVGSQADRTAAATIVASLLAGMRDASAGVVLAGPPAAAGPSGALHAVRTTAATARSVSTVDSLGFAAGRLTTVMALAAESAGRTGRYGSAAGDARGLPVP